MQVEGEVIPPGEDDRNYHRDDRGKDRDRDRNYDRDRERKRRSRFNECGLSLNKTLFNKYDA